MSVVSGPDHPEYAQFESNAGDDAPKKLNKIYFYHITNSDAVVKQGMAPIFEERGPYVFRETFKHHNVSLLQTIIW
jgi:hypothetical protein